MSEASEATPGAIAPYEYSVQLDSEPAFEDAVIIVAISSRQVVASPPSLTFTAASWHTEQPVTLTAVDDHIVQPEVVRDVSVVHAVHTGSGDALLNISNITVGLLDDDAAGFSISSTLLHVREGVGNALAEAAADSCAALFDHGACGSTTSAECRWVDCDVTTVRGLCEAGFCELNPSELERIRSLAAVAAGDSFAVTATAQPVEGAQAAVAIRSTPGVFETSVRELIFDSTNWNVPQLLAVWAVPDHTQSGARNGTLAFSPHAALTTDAAFRQLTNCSNGTFPILREAFTVDTDAPGWIIDIQSRVHSDTGSPCAKTGQQPVEQSLEHCLPFAQGATCCNATEDQNVPDRLAQLLTASARDSLCGATLHLLLCGTQCSSAQSEFVGLRPDGSAVLSLCTSFCTRLAQTCAVTDWQGTPESTAPEAVCRHALGGFFDEILLTTNSSCFGGGLFVEEDGSVDATSFYRMKLATQPATNVSVFGEIGAGDGAPSISLSTSNFEFTADNWARWFRLGVQASDDDQDTGLYSIRSVSHRLNSSDINYQAEVMIEVYVFDNDRRGVNFGTAPMVLDRTREANSPTNATYTISLATRPTEDVNISMTATASVRVSPVSLVISPDQWNAPHQIMLDLLETGFPGGMQAVQIQHSFGSLDLTYGDYPDQYFPLSIRDYGLEFSVANVTVMEGYNASYTIRMTVLPAEDLTVGITLVGANDDVMVAATPTTLLFTPTTYAVWQTVTILGPVDDDIDHGKRRLQISHTVTSSNSYLATQAIHLNVLSDDAAGIEVFPRQMQVPENSHSDYQIRLTTRPKFQVTLNLTFGGGLLQATPSTLMFTPDSWDDFQNFTVYGIDNDRADGYRLVPMIVVSNSTDFQYDSRIVPVSNESTCNPDSNCDPFMFSEICGVTMDASNTTEESVYDSLCFAQRACARILYASPCDGRKFALDGLAVQTVNVSDNDVAGIYIDNQTMHVGEAAGATEIITVHLETEPYGDVTVTLMNNNSNEQLEFAPVDSENRRGERVLPLTFDSTNWQTPQRVRVGGYDDLVDEPENHTARVYYLVHSHTDASYDVGMTEAGPSVTIADNDCAMVSISADTIVDAVTEGQTAQYIVWLETQPTANVTIEMLPSQVEFVGRASAAAIVFTMDDWHRPKAVVIRATDDFDIERTAISDVPSHRLRELPAACL
eukprot:SAG31_NODE_463_length_15332_cov_5.907700_7_plen_1181_part_00